MRKSQISNLKSQKYCSGQAVIVTVVFMLFVSLTAVAGFSSVVLTKTKTTRKSLESKKSYFLAEAGAEDVVYRATEGMNYDNEEVLTLDGFTATTTVAINVDGEIEVTTRGEVNNAVRKTMVTLEEGAGASFNYGVQSGNGGVNMDNSSSIQGSLFSNGEILGADSDIAGDAISAGPSGLIDNINTTGSAYAHSITDSDIDVDAYYDSDFSGSTALGVEHSGQADQELVDMPIDDTTIVEWETAAETGGVINSPECDSGEYTIGSDTTIGPVKIECDLTIEDNVILTLTGPVWVVGEITIKKPTVQVDASVGNKSVAVIADNASDRITSSGVFITNTGTKFYGNGGDKSYILVISMNNDSEVQGGDPDAQTAIEAKQGDFEDLLLYAPHGEIIVQGGQSSLQEVTGYRIEMGNNAEIIYETGLANLLFDMGPGGGYTLIDWEEI